MNNILRYSFYPFIIIFTLVLNTILFNYVSDLLIPLTSLICISSAMMISIIIERVIPYRKEWNKNLGDLWTDMIQTNIIFPIVLKIAEVSIFFLIAHYSLKIQLFPGFETLPIFYRLVILVILAEFIYYWIHRIGHTVKVFWRFHAVHHGADRVYWANAARFHFLDEYISIFFYIIPFAIFSSDIKLLALFYTLTAVTGVLEHVNIDFRGRYLNYVFNTAHLHRWHHSTTISECNSNYGKILCIWDLVFNTWYLPKDKDVKEVGIRLTRKIPNSVLGQMAYPFTNISIKKEN